MKIAFNTGRFYAECGQPITAEKIEGVVVFVDHARGIEGEIPLMREGVDFNTQGDLARHVLYMYDHNQYRHVSTYEGPVFNSKRDQQSLGYDEWVQINRILPVQRFMLT